MMSKLNKKQLKEQVQHEMMHLIGNISYVIGDMNLNEEHQEQFLAEAKKQADRVAKLFGYDEAWFN